MIEELKPCPKCGPDGVPLRRIGEMDEYRVECVECYTVKTPWFKTLKEAEAYWNAFAEGMKQQAARIAELEKMAEARKLANRLLEQERNELEAERDQLQEALQKIAEMEAGSHEPSFEMRGCMTSESCMNCDEMIDIARKALKGAGE
ncbi:hypothetical protein [uncultured Victivallis sp.]|uniref:hypothetical protein n=1 Tax=uncultured Victivallis sp. TaxID=354118 RepID=UPI0025960C60|nr:hypothetical protein [uncultured Victivallis sp.]